MGAVDFLTSFARSTVDGARVRPYGIEVADLEIDFDAPRAFVASHVLAACLRCDVEVVWGLTLQARILLLLGISEISLADPVEAHLRCECGENAVVELSADELAQFAFERRRDELVARAGQRSVTLRLPTGRDQLRWAHLDPASDPVRSVLADLVVAGELVDELVVAADALLTEVDPVIELAVETACPKCGAHLTRSVDLEQIALTRLRNVRRVLLQQVDAIASTYHWTEAEIARLPAWRRGEYAELVTARRR